MRRRYGESRMESPPWRASRRRCWCRIHPITRACAGWLPRPSLPGECRHAPSDQGTGGRAARPVADKGEMDVMRDLAHRLPVIVICDNAGHSRRASGAVPGGQQRQRPHPRALPMTRGGTRPGQPQHPDAGVYFNQLCELRRREPRDDLTTELVKAEEAGDKLSAEELQANIGLLFGAGTRPPPT